MATEEELIEHLQNLAEELGHTPRQKDMDEKGDWSTSTYENYFNTWNDALKKAGLELNVEFNITEERLIEELKRLSNKLNRPLSREDMDKYGKWSCSAYNETFNGWNNALEEAGLEVNETYKYSKEKLIKDLQELADELGRTPRYRETEKNDKPSASAYENHFGTWNNALEEAGLERNCGCPLSRKEMIKDLQELSNELGRTLTEDDISKHRSWSIKPYHSEFGTWSNALEKAGLELNMARPGEGEHSYGENYVNKKKKCNKRDNYRCRVCYDYKHTHTHHIKPRRKFNNISDSNTLDNLITLCRTCHSKFEGNWQDNDPDEFAELAQEYLEKIS